MKPSHKRLRFWRSLEVGDLIVVRGWVTAVPNRIDSGEQMLNVRIEGEGAPVRVRLTAVSSLYDRSLRRIVRSSLVFGFLAALAGSTTAAVLFLR